MHIVAAEVENLRGYSQCLMKLNREKTILVGRNNSGKTSLLRIIDWVMNQAPQAVMEGAQEPSSDHINFLRACTEDEESCTPSDAVGAY